MPLNALSKGRWSHTEEPVQSLVQLLRRQQWQGQPSHDYTAELHWVAGDIEGECLGQFKWPFNVQVAPAHLSTCPPIRTTALVTPPQPSMWPRGTALSSAVHCGSGWGLRFAHYHHIISQKEINRLTQTLLLRASTPPTSNRMQIHTIPLGGAAHLSCVLNVLINNANAYLEGLSVDNRWRMQELKSSAKTYAVFSFHLSFF